MTNHVGDANKKGDAMSDIARWAAFDGGIAPHPYGKWILCDDHQAEVEQLTRQRSENFAEIERLTRAQDRLRDRLREALEERNNVCYEAVELREKLVEAQAEVERLKEQVAALTVAVEQADEAKADAEAAAAAEETETDRVMVERDAAQAEVERLRANGQGMFDSSRPSDEDIWREGFMRCLNDVAAEDWQEQADLVLATYRKRWPR